MEVTGGTKFILPDATKEACLPIDWMQPNFMDPEGNLIMSIHALVIDTGDKRIIVDTCIGNDKQRNIPTWSNLQTNFLNDLEEVGYPKESIDLVMCTHLHVDHVGWNTMLVEGEWIPTFPNARYLIAEKEWTYWDANENEDLYGPVISDSVRPVVDAGMVDFVDDHFSLCNEVCLSPTPGHTPGHVSVLINSKKKRALITGDFIHHPVQMTNTDWCSPADYDQKQAQLTRETLLEKYVNQDILIIGTHFSSPTAGHIKYLEGGGYWLDINKVK
jgi:glyoxylase-like metal-dependent hydrolase (beta-lactamase superfamily II)